MARLEMIDPAKATGPAADLLSAVREKLGMTPNMTRSMANSPAVLTGYLGLSGALAKGALSARLREQIALMTAETNACQYCLSAHTAIGKSVGLTEGDIAASRNGGARDSREDAALKFARSVLDQRGGVSDSDFEAVRSAGFDDGEVAEIVANVVSNVFTNYFNRAAQPAIDFPAVDPACAC